MINLRERADLIGGTVNIESVPGKGTRVTLVVPVSKEAT
jgi:signal transduction histidine kinase